MEGVSRFSLLIGQSSEDSTMPAPSLIWFTGDPPVTFAKQTLKVLEASVATDPLGTQATAADRSVLSAQVRTRHRPAAGDRLHVKTSVVLTFLPLYLGLAR